MGCCFSTDSIKSPPEPAHMNSDVLQIVEVEKSVKRRRMRRLAWIVALVGIVTLVFVIIASRPDAFRNAWRALDDERRYWDGRRRELSQKRRANEQRRRAEEQGQRGAGNTNAVSESSLKP
jgi:hypothetical protein